MFNLSNTLPQWVSDASSTAIVDANDAALRLWRYRRDEFIGRPATDLLCEEEVPRSERLRQINQWGETGPWRCKRGDGSEFFMSVRWQQVVHNGLLCNFVFPTAVGESLESLHPILFEANTASRCWCRSVLRTSVCSASPGRTSPVKNSPLNPCPSRKP